MKEVALSAVIAATGEEAERLCGLLRAELSSLPEGRDRFAIELMAREALANAVEHGSHFDAAKWVSFSLVTRGDFLVCRVADEGPGFPGRQAEARAALESGAAPMERGKGILIMEEYSDRLYFEDGGRTVVFERRIEKGKES